MLDIPDFVSELCANSMPYENNSRTLPWALRNLGREFNYQADKFGLHLLPSDFEKRLFNYQKEGIQFGLSRHGRVLLADEMGVGKTVQAIALAYIYKQEWPLLIIAPSFLRMVWFRELEKWFQLPSFPTYGLRGPVDIQIINSSRD